MLYQVNKKPWILCFYATTASEAAEAYALRKAVVVALEESLSLVIVESDAQALILGVKNVSKLLSWDRFTNYD